MGDSLENYPTLDEIDKIEEIMDAFEICMNFDVVPPEDSLDDLKDRLKLEYYRRLGVNSKAEVRIWNL